MIRDNLPVIGRTIFLGQQTEMRKFNVILPTDDTEGDWEEMPWLAVQGVGLIHDIGWTTRSGRGSFRENE